MSTSSKRIVHRRVDRFRSGVLANRSSTLGVLLIAILVSSGIACDKSKSSDECSSDSDCRGGEMCRDDECVNAREAEEDRADEVTSITPELEVALSSLRSRLDARQLRLQASNDAIPMAWGAPDAVYRTQISDDDKLSSRGSVLGAAGAIVRQERAWVHRLGQRDPDDQSDSLFGERDARDWLPSKAEEGMDAQTKRAIVNREPFIEVRAWQSPQAVRVTILDE